jgi:hypothetical protein
MQQIIVSDDFYGDVKQMHSLFSSLDYSKNSNFLQGLICPMQYTNQDMLSQMEYILGVPENSFEFVDGSGSFIINTENDLPSRAVCVNIPDMMTQWVGILCLNKSELPHFLKFYKHNKTKWNELPNTPEEFEKENIKSYEDFETFMQKQNENWENNWTETSRIELLCNRLIFIRPGLFHSYNDIYGTDQESGRMLQFFFLKPKAVPQQ